MDGSERRPRAWNEIELENSREAGREARKAVGMHT